MTDGNEQFCHCHLHSDYSQLDGCCKVESYVQEADQRGNPAIALTEHGSMRSFFELHQQTKDTAVKPIYGIEFYIVEDMHRKGMTSEEKEQGTKGMDKTKAKAVIKQRERDLNLRGSYHLTAWAKNETGLRNLFKLSSLGWTEGFYYRPRIDYNALADYMGGVAIGTACVTGIAAKLVEVGDTERAYQVMDMLYNLFGADLWLEGQARGRGQAVCHLYGAIHAGVVFVRYCPELLFSVVHACAAGYCRRPDDSLVAKPAAGQLPQGQARFCQRYMG
ncbi:hypothetical protein LCGC14_1243330, partial [marine sediment metagenome]